MSLMGRLESIHCASQQILIAYAAPHQPGPGQEQPPSLSGLVSPYLNDMAQ